MHHHHRIAGVHTAPRSADPAHSYGHAMATYAAGLAAVRKRLDAGGVASVGRDRAAVLGQLHEFLSGPYQVLGLTVQTCVPSDILVFFEAYWLPGRGRTRHADGSVHCSHAYVRKATGFVKTHLETLGRNGPWQGALRCGWCLSHPVSAKQA